MSVNQVPTLYVVATPIGNLQDISLRALEVLKTVDAIAAEDTRHTSHLLSHFAIQKKLIAVHEHNEQKSAQILLERLRAGESIALVTDAGTPGISDPGAIVVDVLREAGVSVVPVPGASAVVAALSASGITANGFMFQGFLPASGSQRRKVLEGLKAYVSTLVFYEAPHRIIEWLENDPNQQRGEFVLMVEAAALVEQADISEDVGRILRLLLADLPLKQAVKLATEITGVKKNILYEYALKLKDE